MRNKKILFGICGSFCNHSYILSQLKSLCISNDIQIIVSKNVYEMDTRFHKANSFLDELKQISGNEVWHTLQEAERVGPMNCFDLYVIAPLTSTMLSRLKNGIYDKMKNMLQKGSRFSRYYAKSDLFKSTWRKIFKIWSMKKEISPQQEFRWAQ